MSCPPYPQYMDHILFPELRATQNNSDRAEVQYRHAEFKRQFIVSVEQRTGRKQTNKQTNLPLYHMFSLCVPACVYDTRIKRSTLIVRQEYLQSKWEGPTFSNCNKSIQAVKVCCCLCSLLFVCVCAADSPLLCAHVSFLYMCLSFICVC